MSLRPARARHPKRARSQRRAAGGAEWVAICRGGEPKPIGAPSADREATIGRSSWQHMRNDGEISASDVSSPTNEPSLRLLLRQSNNAVGCAKNSSSLELSSTSTTTSPPPTSLVNRSSDCDRQLATTPPTSTNEAANERENQDNNSADLSSSSCWFGRQLDDNRWRKSPVIGADSPSNPSNSTLPSNNKSRGGATNKETRTRRRSRNESSSEQVSIVGEEDWSPLLTNHSAATAAATKYNKQQQEVFARRGGRSSSITSDYYSATTAQNSPQTGRTPLKSAKLYSSPKSSSPAEQQYQSRGKATIYENPAYLPAQQKLTSDAAQAKMIATATATAPATTTPTTKQSGGRRLPPEQDTRASGQRASPSVTNGSNYSTAAANLTQQLQYAAPTSARNKCSGSTSSSGSASASSSSSAASDSRSADQQSRLRALMSGVELDAAVSSALAARRKQLESMDREHSADCLDELTAREADCCGGGGISLSRNHVAAKTHTYFQATHNNKHYHPRPLVTSANPLLATQSPSAVSPPPLVPMRQRAQFEAWDEERSASKQNQLVSLSSQSSSSILVRQSHQNYYYAPPSQVSGLAVEDSPPMTMALNQQRAQPGAIYHTSNEATNTATTSTNPSDQSDYHYYQVVVPELSSPPPASNQPFSNQIRQSNSPCKSIQRMVSSIFSPTTNHPTEQRYQLTHNQIPTINQNLVISEPLIRSNSWQNKTLIDLRQQQQGQAIQGTLPCAPRFASQWQPSIELSSIQHQQQSDMNQEHLYCGLHTMRAASMSQQPATGNAYQHNQSFQHKTSCSNLTYQPQVAPWPLSNHPQVGPTGARLLKDKLQRRASLRGCLLTILAALVGCLLVAVLFATFIHREQQKHQQAQPQDQMQMQPVNLKPIAAPAMEHNPYLNTQNVYTNAYRAKLPSPVISAQYPPMFSILPAMPENHQPASSTQASSTTTTQKATKIESPVTQVPSSHLIPSTQSYWSSPVASELKDSSGYTDTCHLLNPDFACKAHGQCVAGQCLCSPGFSGPNCHVPNCPNRCSQHGLCKLNPESVFNQLATAQVKSDAYLLSFGYQTLASSMPLHSQSVCQSAANTSFMGSEGAQSRYNDQRLEWKCHCEPGFTGSDCAQMKELTCDNGRDDDDDGLIDCEDDDCCEKAVCRDNLMCLKAPDPARIVRDSALSDPLDWFYEQRLQQQEAFAKEMQALEASDRQRDRPFVHNFYVMARFLIKNGSVQSYATEEVFNKSRVAIIRGRVIKADQANQAQNGNSPRGNVNVRVSVLESANFGFTLTRSDGYFDMLVNGDEWITLQFHRNAYAPIKRKILVKARSINVLDEDVEMWLANGGGVPQASASSSVEFANLIGKPPLAGAPTFDVQSRTELYKLVASYRRDAADERRRNLLYDCLVENLVSGRRIESVENQFAPKIIVADRSKQSEKGNQPLRTFVLASEGSFKTALNRSAPLGNHPNIHLLYNSASSSSSGSAVKLTFSLQLLGESHQLAANENSKTLSAIIVQLNIEGQSIRERLAPLPGLVYRYAWDRRNVYGQKVYGFSPLKMRIGYEYQLRRSDERGASRVWSECLVNADFPLQHSDSGSAAAFESIFDARAGRQVVWFESQVYLEAHSLNQHSDVGKWALASSNRFDPGRNLIYFASGWTLPFGLAYPPVLTQPINLTQVQEYHRPMQRSTAYGTDRLMSRGPNSLMFVIISGTKSSPGRRLVLLDTAHYNQVLFNLPLAALTGKFSQQLDSVAPGGGGSEFVDDSDDTQILYNNYQSTLYLSSRTAGKILQVSYSSLVVLNKTLNQADGFTTGSADDEIDIDQVCGFGRQTLASVPPSESLKPSRQVRLAGPHSMTLDEANQVLYFIDGANSLMALDLSSHRVMLMQPTKLTRPRRKRSSPKAKASQQQAASDNDDECHQMEMEAKFSQYNPGNIHSLVWSQADSSLYFIDQRFVLALRQDLTLEPIALGTRHIGEALYENDLTSQPANCKHQHKRRILGHLRALSADEANNDLLIVHEQGEQGRLLLAKAKLGIRTNGDPVYWPRRLIDLHSAESAWNPLISRVAEWRQTPEQQMEIDGQLRETAATKINWLELANPLLVQSETVDNPKRGRQLQHHQRRPLEPLALSSPLMGSRASKPAIPFIHLERGFERIDSIEINSDGSIFVLDSQAHSIRRVQAYEPLSQAHNLVERFDSNLERVFVTNNLQIRPDWPNRASSSPSPPDSLQSRPSQLGNLGSVVSDLEDRKLNVLIVQNPINNDLMEFHSVSGLQLANSHSGSGKKIEFYYTILAQQQQTSGDQTNGATTNDDDDKHDVDALRAMFNYIVLSGEANRDNLSSDTQGAHVRLNSLYDHSTYNDYLFSRTPHGQKYLLDGILTNSTLTFTLITDASGSLTEFRGPLPSDGSQPGARTELVYGTSNNLLRDIIQGSQFRRIVYDRLFNHYCDLFQS